MQPADIFRLVNTIAFISWLAIFFAPKAKLTKKLIHSGLVAGLLSLVYFAYLFIGPFNESGGDFMTLAGVMRLFQSEQAVLGGWVHYLVFDMLIGSWMSHDAEVTGLKHFQVLPFLVFTFLMGPVGLLGYLILKKYRVKQLTNLLWR